MTELSLTYTDILDSIAGVSYVVAEDGRILAYGPSKWVRFARENNSEKLADPEAVLGKSLFSFISGEKTRQSYRHFHEIILNNKRDCITFSYRCDAPEWRRDMQMTMTPLLVSGHVRGILYQSQTLRKQLRPPLELLAVQATPESHPNLTVLPICSYCKDVRFRSNGHEQWIHPEEYYRRGGKPEVALSHSICPNCYQTIVEPMLADLDA